MLNPIHLREATYSDAQTLAYLHTESWRSAYTEVLPAAYLGGHLETERAQVWRQRMSNQQGRQFTVLAELEREAVGFVHVTFEEEPEHGALLDNLHVRPHLKRQGIGRLLLGEAARRVRALEPGWPMHLWVFSDNLPAQRFYGALGGELAEAKLKPTPAGTLVSAVRYVWHDLSSLTRV
ncbi:MAG: GNAT family N-acetyltransferase [Meiothermus sp.]|nr:GNAT family N-acetyltransferase [Meiothermus sp.]